MSMNRSLVARLLRSWIPVAIAVLVAAAAAWAIGALHNSADHAERTRATVAAMQTDVEGPEGLLTDSASSLHRDAAGVPLPVRGAAPHTIGFQKENLRQLAAMRTSIGEPRLVDAVVRNLHAMAAAQDAVTAGGAAATPAAHAARGVLAKLEASFVALIKYTKASAGTTNHRSAGGTWLLALLGALGVVALLRHSDRARRRDTERHTAELRRQALYDPLTGLANRRKLAEDLGAASRDATVERPARMVMFDLDGFKAYNDAFGHHGGDLLLTRLSHALAAAVAPYGTAYRLGGDEFCALMPVDPGDAPVQACLEALTDSGKGFSVSSSHGVVLVPHDTDDPDYALQLADQRMYACKGSGRTSAAQQTLDLARIVLEVQEPELGEHSTHVAELAGRVAQRLGIEGQALAEVIRAAELHDIGKIAIPFSILHKAGPLDDEEWELMRRHATIGGTILGAAPALAEVAEVVRASHERWDGAGYPRGLAGEDIPLTSRIVFACDAFDAMTAPRPYRESLTEAEALEELSRCAGTQFDPAVVSAFRAEYYARAEFDVDPHPPQDVLA
jgi:diguanylate cyclase (GGDEF)-like protein